jgi:WD40 repeat protein
LALLGVGVLVLAVAAYAQGRLTSEQRDNAMLSTVLAASESLRSTDPSLSAQLDLVAHRIRPADQEVDSRLLSTQNLPLATPLVGHTGAVTDLAYQPGGRLLASAGADQTVRLWDVTDSDDPHQLGEPLSCPVAVSSVAFSPDGATMAASCGRSILRWNVEDPEHPRAAAQPMPDSDTAVTDVAFGPSGRILAAADDNRAVTLWNVENSAAPSRAGIAGPMAGPIQSMVFDPSGAWVALADADSVRLWSVLAPAAPAPLGPPITVAVSPIRAIAVSADGVTLAVGGGENSFESAGIGDATVALWNIADPLHPNQVGTVLSTAKSTLRSVAFSPDGDTLAVGDRSSVKIWNIADRARPMQLGETLSAAALPCPDIYPLLVCQEDQNALVFGPDGNTLAAGSAQGVVRLWSLPPAVIGGRLGWSVLAPEFSAGGSMVTGALDADVTLWDLRDRARVRRLAGLGPGPDHNAASGSTISRDGRLVATVTGFPPRLRLLDVSDPARVRTLSEIPDVLAGMFSPGSRYLWTVSVGTAWNMQIWDLADPARPIPVSAKVPVASKPTSSMAVNAAHDDLVATMGPDRADSGAEVYPIKLWDLSNPAEPRQVGSIPGTQSKPFGWFDVTPDGKTLVTLAANTLQAWDISVPSNVRPLGVPITTHGLNIQSIDISPDGRSMATGSADSTVRLWDITDRAHPKPIGQSITVPSTTSWQLTYDPAGRYLIGTGNGVMRMWDLDVENAITRICDVTRAVLTHEVWQARLPQMAYRPPCGE